MILWDTKEERQCYNVGVLQKSAWVKCKHERTNSDWQNVNECSNILCGVNFVSNFIVDMHVLLKKIKVNGKMCS